MTFSNTVVVTLVIVNAVIWAPIVVMVAALVS